MPQPVAGFLDEGSRPGYSNQVKPHRQQHQVGRNIKRHLHRQRLIQQQAQATQGAHDRACQHVTGQASEIVGQMQGQGRLLLRQMRRKRSDDTAAHANAMRAAQQADEKNREKTGI